MKKRTKQEQFEQQLSSIIGATEILLQAVRAEQATIGELSSMRREPGGLDAHLKPWVDSLETVLREHLETLHTKYGRR